MPHHRRLTVFPILTALGLAMLQAAQAAPILLTPLPAPRPADAAPLGSGVAEGYRAMTGGRLAEAERAFRAVLKTDPRNVDAHVGLAELAMQRKQPAQAEGFLKQALEIDPERAETKYAMGRWLSTQGKHTEAESWLRKAAQAKPQTLQFWLPLGDVQLWGLKKPKDAEAAYRTALRLDAGSVEAQLGLANALVGQRRDADAVAAFEQAARLAPTEPLPMLSLSRYHASRGQVDAALATLDRLIAAQPGVAQAYLERGDLFLLKGQVEPALQSFHAMVRAVPKDAATGHLRIAALLQAQQKWDDAEAAYRAAITADPRFYAAYNNLAFMLAERRQKLSEAQQLARKAIALQPGSPSAHDTLGWVLRSEGKLKEALAAVSKAASITPRNPVYQYHLGILNAELSKPGDAERAFKRSLELDAKSRFASDIQQRLATLGAKR